MTPGIGLLKVPGSAWLTPGRAAASTNPAACGVPLSLVEVVSTWPAEDSREFNDRFCTPSITSDGSVRRGDDVDCTFLRRTESVLP